MMMTLLHDIFRLQFNPPSCIEMRSSSSSFAFYHGHILFTTSANVLSGITSRCVLVVCLWNGSGPKRVLLHAHIQLSFCINMKNAALQHTMSTVHKFIILYRITSDLPSRTTSHPLPKEQNQTTPTKCVHTLCDSIWITKISLAQGTDEMGVKIGYGEIDSVAS